MPTPGRVGRIGDDIFVGVHRESYQMSGTYRCWRIYVAGWILIHYMAACT